MTPQQQAISLKANIHHKQLLERLAADRKRADKLRKQTNGKN